MLILIMQVINIHGGAFMLGASGMVNIDQIHDCLDRGWIVIVPNHRLCPQVTLLDGPMRDCRDLLEWIYDGGLNSAIRANGAFHSCDLEHIFAFGTSSGGHLALSLVGEWNDRLEMVTQLPSRDLECLVQWQVSLICMPRAASAIPSGPAKYRPSPQSYPKNWMRRFVPVFFPSHLFQSVGSFRWRARLRDLQTLVIQGKRLRFGT